MRAKLKITAAVLVLAVLVSGTVVMANTGDTPRRPPWENEDGTMDVSKLPPTRPVVDRTGEVVGTVSTDYMRTGERPEQLTVTGPDGQVVGYMVAGGFWALGEPRPERRGFSISEEYDAAGELTRREVTHYGD